jgi:hypothetical protein
MNVYVALTREFNVGRLRAIISSGQPAFLPFRVEGRHDA